MNKQQFMTYLNGCVTRYSKTYKLNTGKAFTMWYAVEGLEIDEVEAFEAVSYDGGNDKDIDLFYIDQETERVLIGQMKFNGAGNYSAKKGELLGVLHATDWLKDPEALERDGRSDLAGASRDYEEAIGKGYSVHYLYVYTGPDRKDVQDAVRQFNVMETGTVISRSCRVVSLPLLIAEHEERIDQSTRIAKGTITVRKAAYYEEEGQFGKALVASLDGEELRQLHVKHGDRLFSRNIRLFLGARKGGVNAGIQDTLQSVQDRRNFWAYNNGVTFICDRYSVRASKVTLHNFSIVNGCQTTVSLVNSTASAARDAKVLARFIAAPERIVDDIIRFNNSQNPIRVWELTAQDKLQKRLKRQLATLSQPFLYVLRKGETRQLTPSDKRKFRRGGKSSGEMCSIRHDLNAQYLAAFRGLPAIAYKDKGRIFSAYYHHVFPAQIRPEEVVLVWQAGCVAHEVTKKELVGAVKSGDQARIAILKRGAKFFVLAVMAVILHERNGQIFLNQLKAAVAVSKRTQERLANYAAIGLEWYVSAMRDLLEAGNELPVLVRSQDSWEKIKAKAVSQWKVYQLSKKVVEESLPKL